jgi:hypothetical protein
MPNAKPAAPTYAPAALPVNSVQWRHASGGTGTVQANAYVQACRTLLAWAGTGPSKPYAHAVVHLGWCTGTGARATCKASGSAACKHAAPVLAFGKPAAPQVCTVLAALAKAGAPAPALATVWATFTGKA